MSSRRNNTTLRGKKGFTIIELLVSTSVVAVLAAVAIPVFHNYKVRGQLTAVITEFKTLEKAVLAYQYENNSYPIDTNPGEIPTEITNYIKDAVFTNDAPIGGSYDYEGPPNWSLVGLSVKNSNYANGAEEWTMIDSIIDDGDTSTGKFRMEQDAYVYIVDENV